MSINTESNKETFLDNLTACLQNRAGGDRFMIWLCGTDFFTAPASTRFHLSEPGGLCQHSLNVHSRMIALLDAFTVDQPSEFLQSAWLVAMLHDVCKANFYTTEMRNKKDENNKWIQVPFYTVADQFPYGHGEKSVYLIDRFVRLRTEEAVAIRWHMGGFDEAVKGGSYAIGEAYDKYPLALFLHMADMMASHVDEVKKVED